METSTEAGDRVVIGTERLLIRPWESTDVAAALGIYGDPEVTRWLRPLMGRVRDERTMAAVLDRWRAADREAVAAGRPVGLSCGAAADQQVAPGADAGKCRADRQQHEHDADRAPVAGQAVQWPDQQGPAGG